LAVVWVLGVGGIAFLWQLGDTGLFDETEPVFAETARQMLERNDWGTPYFNDHLRFDKPPLMYWLVAIGYQLLGVNEWAARLPSALAAIALLGLCFYSLQRFRQTPPLLSAGQLWVPGMVGAAIVAFNPLMLVWGRAGVADMLLVSTLSGALLAFFIGYSQPHCPANQRRWYAVFYSLLGFAVLAKGLVAIALPVVILPTFLFYCGNARQVWRELRPGRGIWLTLAIAAPWFGLMLITHGQLFIDKFFFYHHVEEAPHITRIWATIHVERDSQKGIVIGKGGAMLKAIGSNARHQIQKLLMGDVYLELFVKVQPKWRQSRIRLAEFGYQVEE